MEVDAFGHKAGRSSSAPLRRYPNRCPDEHSDPLDCPALGFLGRKSDGEPGAKTLWMGMRNIAVFMQGSRYARELGELG
jgi:hypothetical protein